MPFFEAYTLLSAIASVTSKLRIGQVVTCNSYRSPALLAKMSSTLDAISNGRLEFGIGVVGLNMNTIHMATVLIMLQQELSNLMS